MEVTVTEMSILLLFIASLLKSQHGHNGEVILTFLTSVGLRSVNMVTLKSCLSFIVISPMSVGVRKMSLFFVQIRTPLKCQDDSTAMVIVTSPLSK